MGESYPLFWTDIIEGGSKKLAEDREGNIQDVSQRFKLGICNHRMINGNKWGEMTGELEYNILIVVHV